MHCCTREGGAVMGDGLASKVLIPALILCLAMIGLGLYRSRPRAR